MSAMSYPGCGVVCGDVSIATVKEGRVLLVTIDRPHRRNAVDRTTAELLHRAFCDFDADPSVDVAVLAGASGTFCSGADLIAIAEGDPNMLATPRRMVGSLGPMGPTRLELSKPVIAAIEGHAVAGGLELALWCELRVAAADAVLGVFSRRFGVPLIDGGTVRLPRLIGHSRAMDLILTGRPVTAAQALEMGLVNRVCPTGQAVPEALALAHQIAGFPQDCLREDMASAREQWDLQTDGALFREAAGGRAVLESGQAEAGARAFAAGAGRHGLPRR